MSAEIPEYEVVSNSGAFELRRYPGYLTASVHVRAASHDAAMNAGFNPLADYIFGSNHGSDKISMTAPVTAGRACCEKIGMAVPVTAQESEGEYVVSFTMPSGYTLDSLPTPNNPAVQLAEVGPHLEAVVRFGGRFSEKKVAEAQAGLEEWIAREGLLAAGAPVAAQYDAPWKPGFARRNEIMIAVEER